MQHVLANLLCQKVWPDRLDTTAVVVFLALILTGPALGYWLMVIDIRAYLRALRGAIICVKNHLPHLPSWAREETPGCLRTLGLQWPCTEEDVKRAYHKLAKELHPDRGGDRRHFLLLQEQFEAAVEFVRQDA